MKTTISLTLAAAALFAGYAISGQALAGDQPRADAPRVPMQADKDGDGRVSRAEAAAAADARINEWFDKLDLNKDGYVTPEESRQLRETRRGEVQAKKDEYFKAADINNDGSLSLDEVQAKMPKLAERFDKLDKDKNGLLSKEELQRRGGGHHRQPEPVT